MCDKCLRLVAFRVAMVELIVVPVGRSILQLFLLGPFRLDHQSKIHASADLVRSGVDPVHISTGHGLEPIIDANAHRLECHQPHHQQIGCALLSKVAGQVAVALHQFGKLVWKAIGELTKHMPLRSLLRPTKRKTAGTNRKRALCRASGDLETDPRNTLRGVAG